MESIEGQYIRMLKHIIASDTMIDDRTGTGVYYAPGQSISWDLRDRLGAMFIGRRIYPHLGYKEMLWFLMGKTDKVSLNELGVHYWDEFFKEDGTIGKAYGYQFRNFNGVDQLKNLIEGIRTNPFSRRHIISLWNVGELDDMSLPPCFFNYQVCVFKDKDSGELMFDLIVTSRSLDAFLGFSYNVFASLFLACVIECACFEENAQLLRLRSITWNFGHAHIYKNHCEQVKEYIDSYEYQDELGNVDKMINPLEPLALKNYINKYVKFGEDIDKRLEVLYVDFKDGWYRNGHDRLFSGIGELYDHSNGSREKYVPIVIKAPLSV